MAVRRPTCVCLCVHLCTTHSAGVGCATISERQPCARCGRGARDYSRRHEGPHYEQSPGAAREYVLGVCRELHVSRAFTAVEVCHRPDTAACQVGRRSLLWVRHNDHLHRPQHNTRAIELHNCLPNPVAGFKIRTDVPKQPQC